MASSLTSLLPESRNGKVILGCVTLAGSYCLVRRVDSYLKRRAKSSIRANFQKKCKESIEQVARAVKNDKDALRHKDMVACLTSDEIIDKIKKREITALQVLRIYQALALEAHEKTNCVCWFFPEAEELARELDGRDNKEGLLFGLPVSIKDHYSVKGHESTFGLVSKLFKPYDEDCCIIKVLKSHGAVPFVRTNTPQLMLSYECGNPIFGLTTNPHDDSRGPGGSSGGEGAILGAGGSPLGFGSDIGGSIRMPSFLCGVYGFKPCTGRMSKMGMPRFDYGQILVGETFGPMAPDMDSIITAMKCIWDGQMISEDNKIPPILFDSNEFESKKPLKIGYYQELEMCPSVPAVKRAVKMAVEALKSQGHELVPFSPPDPSHAVLLEFDVLLAHGGDAWEKDLKHDVLDESIASLVGNILRPKWMKKLSSFIAQIFSDPFHTKLAKSALGIGSALGYWNKTEEIMDYRDNFKRSCDKLGLDAVIGPTFPFPAMPKRRTHTMTSENIYMAGGVYVMLYNVLDLPSGNVPVTRVSNQDVANMMSYPKNNQVAQCIQEGMKGGEGLPVGVQVIAPRFRDERALRIMKELEKSIKNVQ